MIGFMAYAMGFITVTAFIAEMQEFEQISANAVMLMSFTWPISLPATLLWLLSQGVYVIVKGE